MTKKNKTKRQAERQAMLKKTSSQEVDLDLAEDIREGFEEAKALLADLEVLKQSSSGLTGQFADGILKSVGHLKKLLPKKETKEDIKNIPEI